MEMTRRSLLVYGLMAALWALVVAWQAEEHLRVKESAKTDLRNRSKDIANTVSACIRGLRFRETGAVLQNRLESVLNELVNGRTNELVKSSELISIVLLNAALAIVAGEKAKNIKGGIRTAEEAIDSGAARKKLQELITLSNS